MDEQKRSESEELLTEKDYLKKYDVRIVVLSRGRAESIVTTRLLPDWIEVVVPDDEIDAYRAHIKNPLIGIPHELVGLGAVRNWCLKRFPENILVMMDDDIKHVYCLTGERTRRITDKEQVVQIILNAAVMAQDLGTHVFGFFQTDIRKFNGTEPFSLCTWVGCVIGVIGRKYDFRNDAFKVDIDYCLQNLLVDRVVWCDCRYTFSQLRDNNAGGNSAFRTEEKYKQSLKSLQDKWGDCIRVRKHKNQTRISTNIGRRQTINYE